MRQSTQSPASIAAIARALFAATAGLALLLATSARAGETVIWSQTGTDDSWAWDTTTANWTGTSGTSVNFTNGDAVVFGYDAGGNPVDDAGGHITIASGGVTIGAQDYGHGPSGTNPGMIIGSGSWLFTGGAINSGTDSSSTILVTGTTTLEFMGENASVGTSGTRFFYNQHISVDDDVDLTLLASDKQYLFFTSTFALDVAGGALGTGADADLTLGTTGSFGYFYFASNTTTQQGGAVAVGGDFSFQTPDSGTSTQLYVSFAANNASLTGGALHVDGDIDFAAPTGTATALVLAFASNTSALQGGAIYSGGDITFSLPSGTDSQLSATFSANTSGSSGGAIYSEGSVTLAGVTTFTSNTAAGSGGAIYALGDVLISGTATFSDNYSGTAGLGGAIYTEGNLIVSGSGSEVSFARDRASGTTAAISTIAHVGGTLGLGEGTTFSTRGGGIAAEEFSIDGGKLVFLSGSSLTNGKLLLTVIDSAGNAVGATDKINLNNATLSGDFGELAVNEGSRLNITGTLTVESQRAGLNPSVISADIAGAGEIYKIGAGNTALSGTNTYTGQTTVAEGTLTGNIAADSDLTVLAGAAYVTGNFTEFDTGTSTILVATERTIANINGAGVINMSGTNLTSHSGYFTGTFRDIARFTKETGATLTIGAGTVGVLDIKEGTLNIGEDKSLVVSGTTIVAATATLGVNISDDTALRTGVLDTTAGSVINITGVGNISSYTTGTSYTVISTTTVIDRNSYTFLINGNPMDSLPTDFSQFLTFAEVSGTAYESGTIAYASGTTIAVDTTLIWNGTANGSAHGTFQVNSGVFNLNTNLADNTDSNAWFGMAGSGTWDGKSLTKTGEGTLILNGTNIYTGTTVIEAGLLVNSGTAVLGVAGSTAGVHVRDTGTMLNHGDINGTVVNEGVFTFESALHLVTTNTTVVTGTTEGGDEITTGTTVVTGSYYTNGNIRDVVNTGTFIVNTGTDYAWTGTLSGTSGVLIKSGAATFTLGGASSYSGDVEVRQGMLAAGKENMFNTFASSTIHSGGTLSLGGYNQSMTYIHNEGMLSMGPAVSGTAASYVFTSATLTVGTLVTGSETTGRIFMRADYNTGAADRLVITGTASGTHAITFSNLNNETPDKTRASIPLIIVSSTDVVFTGTTDVGMGRLMVYRGDGGDLSPDNDIWYLAATTQLSNVADAILSTASVAGLEWAYQIDTVRQRMGDLRQESLMAPPEKRQSPLAYTTVTSKGGNLWMRTNAYHLDADKKITTDAFEQDVYGITFGYDKTYRWEDNQYLLGAYGQISHVKRDFDTRGDGKTNNFGVGFYFSYLKDNGWYGDTTLLITSGKNKFNAHPLDRMSETISGDYRNSAWGLSQEVGKVIKHKKSGLWLEPSGQISFVVVNGKTYHTSATDNTESMEVKIADSNVTQFRAALRTGWDIPRSRVKPHLRAAIVSVHTRGGRIRASVDDPQYYTADMDGKRFEAGAGFSYIINERSQLYLDYEYAKADNYKRPWAFNFGYRRTW